MTQINISATLTEKGISMIIDGDPKVISKDHLNYQRIIDALREGDMSKVKSLVDVRKSITEVTEGDVTITGETVLYKGKEIHNSVTDRMLKMLRLGLDLKPLARFLSKLMNNPSFNSVEQLYRFMESCDLPIMEDGRVLAYKSVNDDYWDTHTGRTFHNLPGSIIEMPRNQVNDNPDQTCSYGLHVCSQNYGMYGSRLMHVAVDPADVVSVPKDYKNAKMRVCKYEVLKDVQDRGFESWEDTPVYDESCDIEEEESDWFGF